MPATSKAQQKLMAMAYSLKKGEMDPKDASQEVKDLADSMTVKQLKDFASTKHEGLPNHVKEYYYWWDTQPQMMAGQAMAMKRDQTDPLVQAFMDFITGKKSKKVEEDFTAPAASVANTPGMGNVVAAAPGNAGSGDIFSAGSKKKKKPMKHVKLYEAYIEEMALGDVNVQRILSAFDTGDDKMKKKISDVVSGQPHTDRKRLETDFRSIGYNELVDMMIELDLQPPK